MRRRIRLLIAIVSAAAVAPVVIASSPAGASFRTDRAIVCRSVRTERSHVDTISSFAGIAATSACNAWAVGNYDSKTLIEHWNGRQWRQVPSPSVPARGTYYNNLNGVAATSFSNAWAVGNTEDFSSTAVRFDHTLIEHWNGTQWSRVPSPDPGSGRNYNVLEAVAASSRADAWAVAWFTSGTYGAEGTLMLHWDGQSWTHIASPTPTGGYNVRLTGVTALSPSNAWAVGYYSLTEPYHVSTLIEHWDGHSWAIVPSADPAGHAKNSLSELNAVAGDTHRLWAVGTFIRPGIRPRTLIETWKGSAWTKISSPNPPGGYQANSLNGVVMTRGGAWAVGGFGASDPIDSQRRGHTLIEHWNGAQWIRVASPSEPGLHSESALTAVAFLAPGKLMAAGNWICDSAIVPIAQRLVRGSWRFVATPGVSGSIC